MAKYVFSDKTFFWIGEKIKNNENWIYHNSYIYSNKGNVVYIDVFK